MSADRLSLAGSSGPDPDSYRSVRLSGITDGVLYRMGRPEGRFEAHGCSYDQGTRQMDLDSVSMRSTRGDRLTAPHGKWVDQESYLTLDQGVRVRSADGIALRAPEVLFSPAAGVVQAPRSATAVVRGRTITGGAVYWDLPSKRIECAAGSSGEYGGLQFEAQGISVDLGSGEFRANRAHIRFRIEGDAGGTGVNR